MHYRRLTLLLVAGGLLAACAEEPPPPTVAEFMENRILLEAAMVRCGQNRSTTKYEAECVNAREAVNRIARAEDEAHRAELEARSERKRRALRRAQEAAADARRRAEELERQRREAEYLAQFGTLPDAEDSGQAPPGGDGTEVPVPIESTGEIETTPAMPEAAAGTTTDLGAIRDELQRRQQEEQ